MSTLKISADPVGQLPRGEDASSLDHATPAMDPAWFQRVQPRAFDRQRADHDTHSGLLPLHLVVVLADPGAYRLTPVPRGVVPDQEQRPFAMVGKLAATPGRPS
jgi:hypothetical protein